MSQRWCYLSARIEQVRQIVVQLVVKRKRKNRRNPYERVRKLTKKVRKELMIGTELCDVYF